MTLDVYYCECDEEFAVKDGKEPNCCPFCHSPEIEWSHSIDEYRFNLTH